MDQTPPKAFADDEDVGFFGKTPEPRRRRVEELERRGELLCREKGSLVRKLDAETKRFDSTLKIKMAELEEMRVLLLKTQKELERAKAECESIREEMGLISLVSQQKALLAMAQEQLQVIELEHRLVQSEQQRVMRDHKIARLHAKEAELQVSVQERDVRIAELETSSSDKEHLASSAHSAAAELAKALKDKSSLSNQIEKLEMTAITLKATEKDLSKALADKAKLAAKIEGLEASVESWKGKEKEARAELNQVSKTGKEKDGSTDMEVRTLKDQLRSANADLETKDGECVDLQEQLASLKERSKEKEKDFKLKLKAANEQAEQAGVLQAQIDELKKSSKKALADAERRKSASKEAIGSVSQDHSAVARKKVASPLRAPKAVKERVRKATSAEPESEAETIPKQPKRVHESPAKAITQKLSKLSREIADESDNSDAPSPPKIRKSASQISRSSSRPSALGESSILNRLVKSSTMSALAAKRKSPGPEKLAPMITVTPADDDEAAAAGAEGGEGVEKGQGEKKKKRKLLGTKAAFKWDPILESGSGVIPSTFSPMKPGTTGMIPRLGLAHSASARALSRI